MKALTRNSSLALCLFLAVVLPLWAQDKPAQPPQDQDEEKPLLAGTGYREPFALLRDSVAFRAYAGVLKGAEGTLEDSAGNSLDRALLLSKLLQERGYKPAIAHGRLRGDALARVVALSQGLTPNPETGEVPHLNPAAEEAISTLLADHYWVQIPAGQEKWIDLDPTLPDSIPGRTIAGFRKRLLRLPSHLFQLIEIGIWAEFTIDEQPVRSRLLRWTKSIPGVSGKPIVLFFVRREADGRFVYSENNRWYPVLWYDGAIQPALNLESEANRLAVRARGVVEPPEVRRIWVDITIRAPGQGGTTTRRTLYSATQPDRNRLGEMQVFRVGTNPPAAGYLQAAATALQQSSTTAAAITPTDYPQVLSDSERNEAAVLADIQRDLCAAIGSAYEKDLAALKECVQDAFLSRPGVVFPHVFSVAVAPETGTMQLDLIAFDQLPAAISPRDVQAVAAAFASGVMASHMEGELLSQFGEDGQGESSLTLTRSYLERGATWRAYDMPTVRALSDAGVDDDLAVRLERAIERGKIIILPQRQEDLPLVWWELDGQSGTAVGMIEPGIGGARIKSQDTADWPYVASSFAPLFSPEWPQRLGAWCQTAANVLRAQNAALPEENGEAVQEVYDLIYTTLATDSAVLLAPGVREFFSPSGRILLRDAARSLCEGSDSTETLAP